MAAPPLQNQNEQEADSPLLNEEIEALVNRYESSLLRVAIQSGMDPDTAADLVQDIWLSILENSKKAGTRVNSRRPRPFGILVGYIFNQRRFQKRHPSRSISLTAEEFEEAGIPGSSLPQFSDPEEALIAKEGLEQLYRAYLTLSISQQNLIQDHIIKELTMREIGKGSAHNASTVSRKLQEIIILLRKEMKVVISSSEESANDFV